MQYGSLSACTRVYIVMDQREDGINLGEGDLGIFPVDQAAQLAAELKDLIIRDNTAPRDFIASTGDIITDYLRMIRDEERQIQAALALTAHVLSHLTESDCEEE